MNENISHISAMEPIVQRSVNNAYVTIILIVTTETTHMAYDRFFLLLSCVNYELFNKNKK